MWACQDHFLVHSTSFRELPACWLSATLAPHRLVGTLAAAGRRGTTGIWMTPRPSSAPISPRRRLSTPSRWWWIGTTTSGPSPSSWPRRPTSTPTTSRCPAHPFPLALLGRPSAAPHGQLHRHLTLMCRLSTKPSVALYEVSLRHTALRAPHMCALSASRACGWRFDCCARFSKLTWVRLGGGVQAQSFLHDWICSSEQITYTLRGRAWNANKGASSRFVCADGSWPPPATCCVVGHLF